MKTITLLRHAKSSWKSTGLTDRERPLNRRGERDALTMGERISVQKIRPSLIVSSPATRAWTTAKIISNSINYPREFLQRDDRLYLASVESIIDVIADQEPGFQHIMVVGHNPGMTQFANFLIPNISQNMPTCAVLSVVIDADYEELHQRPEATLEYLDYPKRMAESMPAS